VRDFFTLVGIGLASKYQSIVEIAERNKCCKLITTLKSFVKQAPGPCAIKLFTDVINYTV
jgi:hypothetical protein